LYISSLYTCIYSGLARALISIQVLFIIWYIESGYGSFLSLQMISALSLPFFFLASRFFSRLPLGNMCLSPVHIVLNSWLQSARFSLGSKCAARAGAVTASSSRTELGGVMRAAGVREGPSTISTECYALHDLHCCWNIGSTPGSSAHSCGVARSEHRPFCAQLWFCWICTSDLLRCWFVIWLCSDPI
jgi:hypothetical protein